MVDVKIRGVSEPAVNFVSLSWSHDTCEKYTLKKLSLLELLLVTNISR